MEDQGAETRVIVISPEKNFEKLETPSRRLWFHPAETHSPDGKLQTVSQRSILEEVCSAVLKSYMTRVYACKYWQD